VSPGVGIALSIRATITFECHDGAPMVVLHANTKVVAKNHSIS
jgi:hypothetical protein